MDLLRDMVEATREAFQKFVLPQLAGGMKDGSTAKMAECACEASLIVGAFSERVVAPRCSAFAKALKEYLMTAAQLTYNVKDEDLPQVIADLAAPSLDPDVLRRHAKKFYSEVDLFCTHVGEAYPKDGGDRSTRRKRRSTTRRRSSLLAPVGAPAPAAAPAAAQRAKTPEAKAAGALRRTVPCRSVGVAGVICYVVSYVLISVGGPRGEDTARSPIHRRRARRDS